MSTATITGLDYERIRAALADLPQLLTIADRARGFYGPIDCAEGCCEHVDGEEQCPLLEERYATADHLEQLDVAGDTLRRVHDLAQRGLTAAPAEALQALQAIADLTEQEGGSTRG
jgi:hypothetical protein